MPGIKHVAAAGGLVYRMLNGQPQVLLILRNGVWDLPKGKLEDETIQECAVREVAEEVGSEDLPAIEHVLAETYHEYERGGIIFGKTTHWFSMKFPDTVTDDFDPQTEEGIEKVKWVPLSEAKKMVGYENLVEALKSFELFYEQQPKT